MKIVLLLLITLDGSASTDLLLDLLCKLDCNAYHVVCPRSMEPLCAVYDKVMIEAEAKRTRL